jgi:hypothetical protein
VNANLASFLYLVSGILFILALRGLSHPTTSRQGNIYGMIGMAIAIVTTLALATPSTSGLGLIVLGLAIGGGVGAVTARRIAMTSMPQLVAAFHSLVGLAAVMVAAAALYAPESFLRHRHGRRHSRPGAGRNGARRRHRRDHLHRLGHRLPEARRPHVGQADHAADAPHDQHRAGRALVVLIVLLVTTEAPRSSG